MLAIRPRVKITNVKELLQLDGTVFYSIKIIINIIWEVLPIGKVWYFIHPFSHLVNIYWVPNLDSVLKSRDITLPTKVHIVKTMFFPVVNVQMWELYHKEGWALMAHAF